MKPIHWPSVAICHSDQAIISPLHKHWGDQEQRLANINCLNHSILFIYLFLFWQMLSIRD